MVNLHLGIMLPQEFHMVLRSFLCLIYINYLTNYRFSNCKLFVCHNIHTSATTTLRQELNAITNWIFQGEMIFNLDLSKQAQKFVRNCFIQLFYPIILR